ncbi:uncharacterized protein LOC122850957 [Aphidius gifuensis]|uniref:uncharacterized protein LOC122850957 n=1 Tax=Aphidius gifuensis TaxID=684658 RepID=UPI001CDD557C|nr:uncharacterized protein LOC122850957 [Aphidius gifuensis]
MLINRWTICCQGLSSENITNFTNSIKIKNNSKNFLCHDPQSRAYHISDLIAEQINLTKNYQSSSSWTFSPAYLVINRCDGYSGCCEAHQACMPKTKEFENITIAYQSLDINSSEKLKKFQIEKHIICFCNLANPVERKLLNTRVPEVVIIDD